MKTKIVVPENEVDIPYISFNDIIMIQFSQATQTRIIVIITYIPVACMTIHMGINGQY